MNSTKIFQDSWRLMLRYRAMWLFGILLALTTVSFGSAVWMRNNQEEDNRTLINWEISAQDQAWIRENFGLDLPLNYTLTAEDLRLRLDDGSLSSQERTHILRVIGVVFVVLFVLWVIHLIIRYTSETALIRMVDDQHSKGVDHTTRQGWSFGFSIAALKLFLIDLLVYPLLILFSILIFIPAMLPVLIAISGTPAGITIGILLMLSLTLVSAAVLALMWIATIVTVRLAHRAACLEGLDIFAAIWRGFRLMRSQLSGVGLTELVTVGLDLVYPILVIPAILLLAAAGFLVGGLLALVIGGLLALVLSKATAWTVAVVVGGLLLVLAIGVPLAWMGGLREIFKSSAWTLTFREAASQPKPAPPPTSPSSIPEAGAA